MRAEAGAARTATRAMEAITLAIVVMSSALLCDERYCSSVTCIVRPPQAACAISHSPEVDSESPVLAGFSRVVRARHLRGRCERSPFALHTRLSAASSGCRSGSVVCDFAHRSIPPQPTSGCEQDRRSGARRVENQPKGGRGDHIAERRSSDCSCFAALAWTDFVALASVTVQLV